MCTRCINNPKSRTAKPFCECLEGLIEKKGKCIKPKSCTSKFGGCIPECFLEADGETCSRCGEKCASCKNGPDECKVCKVKGMQAPECSECKAGYELNKKGHCVPAKPKDGTCEKGFFFTKDRKKNDICAPCDKKCLGCKNSKNECTSCKKWENKEIDGKKCICKKGFKPAGWKCDIDESYVDPNCHFMCETCTAP